MNTALILGSIIVNCALLAYSIGVFFEQKRGRIDAQVVRFLCIGLTLDITATICMIIGSPNGPITLHGLIGYSALAVMFVDTVWVLRLWRAGTQQSTPAKLHLYTRIAYSWWVVAYFAGIALVVVKRI